LFEQQLANRTSPTNGAHGNRQIPGVSSDLRETMATLHNETQETDFYTISVSDEVSLFGVSRRKRPRIAHRLWAHAASTHLSVNDDAGIQNSAADNANVILVRFAWFGRSTDDYRDLAIVIRVRLAGAIEGYTRHKVDIELFGGAHQLPFNFVADADMQVVGVYPTIHDLDGFVAHNSYNKFK
jgi:hypothetical protein